MSHLTPPFSDFLIWNICSFIIICMFIIWFTSVLEFFVGWIMSPKSYVQVITPVPVNVNVSGSSVMAVIISYEQVVLE